jgi:hypothetical protein
MPAIHELIPNAEDLPALEPEELAVVFLQAIGSSGDGMSPGRAIKRGNLFLPGHSPVNGYPAQYRTRVYEALAAAWVWLERKPGQQDPDWVFIRCRSALPIHIALGWAI